MVVDTTEEVIPALKALRASHRERMTVDTPLRNLRKAKSAYNELEVDGLGIPLEPF